MELVSYTKYFNTVGPAWLVTGQQICSKSQLPTSPPPLPLLRSEQIRRGEKKHCRDVRDKEKGVCLCDGVNMKY